MTSPAVQNENCSREKIAAYLDGELDGREKNLLEKHLEDCLSCVAEMNLQKRMFSVLDTAFERKTEIKLPENFAKVVAAHAESNVDGLRSKKERFRALFLCLALFLVILIGHGAWNAFASIRILGEQIGVVLSFIGHLSYNIIIGLTVILRSLSNQPNISSLIILLFFIGIFVFPTLVVSRYFNNSNRF